ncbi:phosducin-like protein [Leptopilina heterotoma]|uniref:phosducin-like protein n=1 Tax=Leptopilina heterotoma TaxID=63436 RepID=UPI001CA8C752|nr:phosducin-like protein [Leptopilina heterotoma]
MATLEDKILGERSEYYCSSSSDEETETENVMSECSIPKPSKWDGMSCNTGPKGVLRDWERFRELEENKKSTDALRQKELIEKISMTCGSLMDKDKENDLETDPELLDLLSDDYLLEYQTQQMIEMFKRIENLRFGEVIHLSNTDEFLAAIDNENKFVTVIIHIYEKNVAGCEAMNGSLINLAKEYPFVKFCKILGSTLNVSRHFKKDGIPALLAYKNGQVIGNFVHVSDSLGEDFFAEDVAAFLTEHGLLNDKKCKPLIISSDKSKEPKNK